MNLKMIRAMERKLTLPADDRRVRFARLIARGIRRSAAARLAGYSDASGAAAVRAVELMRNDDVKALVELYQERDAINPGEPHYE